jgi:outer membrane protein OmpA-like peptidoglycan-associated protein
MIGTGCATKKYVIKTITPVSERVTAVENKNGDQDKLIATSSKEIEELGTDLSRTKEKLNDVDQKAIAAGQSAQQAGQRADGAQRAADGARTLAQQGNDKADAVKQDVQKAVERTISTIDGMTKYQMLKSETVLFPLNRHNLSAESKAQLDDIAHSATGLERYMIEVQGFTDKTGPPQLNEQLSQDRAVEVVRYLVNEHKVPVRTISSIGSGYTQPVGDDKTRDGRAMNRRVEVRVFVPEVGSAAKAMTASR